MTSTLRLPKHSWTKEEEASLVELVNTGGWRSDNGTFCPDHAMGAQAETFVDVGSNDPTGHKAFVVDIVPDIDF
ncbi:retrotransposon protein [Cucumis melo var. makuwa]|uniref:Retrotransposon protein n=1 Tax=Cucumis melo var. makuwa TaxID=1194695 RepID=A0A5A7T155_CUCMM|nr:retrotransposon protein [Cucumis melo var. makuwa]